MSAQNFIAFCGLYCKECPLGRSKIADLARDLRKELRQAKFEHIAKSIAKYFPAFKDYDRCYEVLGSFVRLRCRKICKEGGGPPFCKIRKCCQKKEIKGCWACREFETCKKLNFLRGGHGDAHIKNLRILNNKGVQKFLAGKKYWYHRIK